LQRFRGTLQADASSAQALTAPIMSKMRINELARELEVKPGVILDLLPELGVHDKKTHSSTIDEDVAGVVRERLAGHGSSGDSGAGDAGQEDSGAAPSGSVPAVSEVTAPSERARAEASVPPAARIPQEPAVVSESRSSEGVDKPAAKEASVHAAPHPPSVAHPPHTPPAMPVAPRHVPPAMPVAPARSAPSSLRAESRGATSGPGRVTLPPSAAPTPGQQSSSSIDTRKSVPPTLPPPITTKRTDRPVAPPLPPPLRRSASPITPPLAAGEPEAESTRRGAGPASMLPPPIKGKPVETKHSPFRHEEEAEPASALAPPVPQARETATEPKAPAPVAPPVAPPAVPPVAQLVPSAPAPVAPPVEAATPDRPQPSDLLPPPVVRTDRPRTVGPAIPAPPIDEDAKRKLPRPAPPISETAAPSARMPQEPASTSVESRSAETTAAEPKPAAADAKPAAAEPKPGEILRTVTSQTPGAPTVPPTRVVVPGQAMPSLKPGEPIAGQDARRLRTPEAPGRPPAPGPARPPIPNRPAATSRQVARPIVPPTPEMVERLKQMRPTPAPPAQRPGAPRPRPGEPIYAGPVRPGQPMDRARVPGRPAAGPGMAARGRGMHPTSAPLLPDVAPPPAVPGRKTPPGKRGADRGRRQEFEEKELAFRPTRRRELPERSPFRKASP
jgi:translation initiation factor IF-2